MSRHESFWRSTAQQFYKRPLGNGRTLWYSYCFILVGVYAPFIASSKPLVVFLTVPFIFPFFAIFSTGAFLLRA